MPYQKGAVFFLKSKRGEVGMLGLSSILNERKTYSPQEKGKEKLEFR